MAEQRPPPSSRARYIALSLTLGTGLGIVLIATAFLLVDAAGRGWTAGPDEYATKPTGLLQWLGRGTALYVTPLCWVGVLLLLDGLLVLARRVSDKAVWQAGSPARQRPQYFVLCFLASIAIWLSFDAVNFLFMDAWRYHGLPESLTARLFSYFFAFGAICPAMFLTAELYRRLGVGRALTKKLDINARWDALLIAIGAGLLVFPMVVRSPLGVLTLWLAWIPLLDPVNRRLGLPSLLADWQRGQWSRTLSLMAAGFTCGLLWEFWNYWAIAKWTYSLAFLGPLEEIRYFEMPVIGLLGFPPFALECWVMFQTVTTVFARLRALPPRMMPASHSVL